MRSLLVPFRISDINRLLQAIAGYDETNILCLFHSGISKAFRIRHIRCKSGLFQKQLDITGLTIADNKHLHLSG